MTRPLSPAGVTSPQAGTTTGPAGPEPTAAPAAGTSPSRPDTLPAMRRSEDRPGASAARPRVDQALPSIRRQLPDQFILPATEVRTADRRHLAPAGKAAIIDSHQSGHYNSQMEIANLYGVAHSTVNRLVAERDETLVSPDLLTPRQTHLSIAGMARVRALRQSKPPVPLAKIVNSFGITRNHLDAVLKADPTKGLPKPRPHSHVSEEKKQEIRALLKTRDDLSLAAIARETNTSWPTVKRQAQIVGRSAAAAPAPVPRQVVQMQDWHQVLARNWRVGELFNVPGENGSIDFQVVHEHHAGQPFDPQHFRPYVRGG